MTDTLSRSERSRVMALVHGRDTSPEMRVRRALHAAGFRYRLHVKTLPGKPDIVLPRYRIAIQVQGCLWHAHRCKRFRMPSSNTAYWENKIARNEDRDQRTKAALEATGWRVLVIWECTLASGVSEAIRILSGSSGCTR